MGADWKIYKPVKKVTEYEFIESIKLLATEFPESLVKVISTKWTKNQIQSLIQSKQKGFIEYNGSFKTKNKNTILNLYSSQGLLDFGIFSIAKHSKGNIFGYKLIKGKQDKPTLIIELPYANKSNSINELSKFLYHVNKPFCLNFTNKEQIEYTTHKLINNLFDCQYLVNEWTLKQSNHIYSSSGEIKGMFESQSRETYRSTGIQIIFTDVIEKFYGWKKYSIDMSTALFNYFEGKEAEINFNTKNEGFIKYILEADINLINLSTTYVMPNQLKKLNNHAFDFLLKEDKSSIMIEHQPNYNNPPKEFAFYLYKIEENEYEIRLEVDKYAKDTFIKSLINITGIEMEYSHKE